MRTGVALTPRERKLQSVAILVYTQNRNTLEYEQRLSQGGETIKVIFLTFSMYYLIIDLLNLLWLQLVVLRPRVSSTLLHFGFPNNSHYKDTKVWWCLFLVVNSLLGTD